MEFSQEMTGDVEFIPDEKYRSSMHSFDGMQENGKGRFVIPANNSVVIKGKPEIKVETYIGADGVQAIIGAAEDNDPEEPPAILGDQDLQSITREGIGTFIMQSKESKK